MYLIDSYIELFKNKALQQHCKTQLMEQDSLGLSSACHVVL